MTTAARGRQHEQTACAYLSAQGYSILATNVRVPVGELDIVARDGKALCFVEVRFRAASRFGTAAESITARKRQRLIRAAQWYLMRRRGPSPPARFDVVTIDRTPAGRQVVSLIRGAFTAD